MIRRIGDFFFKYRNGLFPVFFVILALGTRPISSGGDGETVRYAIGIGIALAGQVIRFGTIGLKYIVRGGKNRKVYAEDLVTSGVFAHCRNPLYVGNMLIVLGLSVVAHSAGFYAVGIPLFFFIYYAIIRAEEAYLEERFGEAFRAYCRDVNRYIPSLKGIAETFASMKFRWRRALLKEFNTPYAWVLGILFLMAKNRYLMAGFEGGKPYFTELLFALCAATAVWLVIMVLKKTRTLLTEDDTEKMNKA